MTSRRKQVAQLAGVSEATVSRVLNNVGPIKEETRTRVLEAAEQLGYHPNALAQSMVLQRSGNIGVFLPYVPKVRLFSSYYFSEILSGIGHEVREHGYSLLLHFRSQEDSPSYSLPFRTRKIDAAIILGMRNRPDELEALEELADEGAQFTLVGARSSISGTFNEIDADYREGARLVVRHLAGSGRSRIAFVNGDEQYSNSADRYAGFAEELASRGIASEPEPDLLLRGNYSRTSGYELAGRLYELRHRFDAVFAANDRMALGVLQGLRERGMRAGRDYALAGYDNSDASRLADPPITTVHVPFFEMGQRAAQQLIGAMKLGGGATPQREELPVQLLVRESSAVNQ